jgi:hypothetical protein
VSRSWKQLLAGSYVLSASRVAWDSVVVLNVYVLARRSMH